MTTNPDEIWQTALGELQLQLTGATFDTWLGRTHLVTFEDETFVVGVHNAYAQDWLENRLQTMVVRTLSHVCERPVKVKFVVFNRLEFALPDQRPDPAEAKLDRAEEDQQPKTFVPPEFDWKGVGWFPVSDYESDFWAPLLGRIPFRLWQIVRETDHRRVKDLWTPEHRFSAPELAEKVPCSRRSITGSLSQDGQQNGALQRLCNLDLAHMIKQARVERDPHTMYVLSVRVRLPLLIPDLVAELPERLQCQHDAWLDDHGFDPKDWFMA